MTDIQDNSDTQMTTQETVAKLFGMRTEEMLLEQSLFQRYFTYGGTIIVLVILNKLVTKIHDKNNFYPCVKHENIWAIIKGKKSVH